MSAAPSPRPRPRPNTTTQKTPSERLTGVEDKPAAPDKVPSTQITHCGFTLIRCETPIGFKAAVFVKHGVDLGPGAE